MKYVLIVMLWNVGGGNNAEISFVDFETKAACMQAKQLVGETFRTQQTTLPASGRQDLRLFCQPKSA